MMTDREMIIQYINPAFSALTGYTAEEVLGRHADSIGAATRAGPVRQSIESALDEGQQWRGESPSQRKDGRIYDAAIIISPLHDTEGNLTGYVSSHRDISQQKALERARNQFLTNISHQLRTPVTTLELYAHLMQQTEMSEKSRDYLRTMRGEVDWLIQLVQDILEMAALDSGKTVVAWKPVSVPAMIENIFTRYASQAKTSGLVMTAVSLPSNLPVVKGDQARLEQALAEVVENAIVFTAGLAQSASGGRVTLQVEAVEADGATWVTVTVQDTGPGIPLEEQEKVFDRFFRGGLAESGHIPGVGLGLSIAQEIMRAHGGRVTVESGKVGSMFKLWLLSSAVT
ncbi:MAG: PAS domain S-box protein [Chloroflexi bacterium]|nr:PAS domain S-box protein [Chloroflexota bacterium]